MAAAGESEYGCSSFHNAILKGVHNVQLTQLLAGFVVLASVSAYPAHAESAVTAQVRQHLQSEAAAVGIDFDRYVSVMHKLDVFGSASNDSGIPHLVDLPEYREASAYLRAHQPLPEELGRRLQLASNQHKFMLANYLEIDIEKLDAVLTRHYQTRALFAEANKKSRSSLASVGRITVTCDASCQARARAGTEIIALTELAQANNIGEYDAFTVLWPPVSGSGTPSRAEEWRYSPTAGSRFERRLNPKDYYCADAVCDSQQPEQ